MAAVTVTVLRDAVDRLRPNVIAPLSSAEASEMLTVGGESLSVIVPTASAGEPTLAPRGLSASSISNRNVSSYSSALSETVSTLTEALESPAGMVT